jgi:protein-disulfide isomerase
MANMSPREPACPLIPAVQISGATSLSLCALVITGLLVKREVFHAPPQSPEVSMRMSNWKDYARGQILDSPGKPVTLIVFSDDECPFCRALAARLDTMRTKFPSRLSIYYRNTPIPTHRFARAAAYAAECAGRVGLFSKAHKTLFEESDSLGVRSWGRFASRIGVTDTAAFVTCVRDSLPVTVLQNDEKDAKRLNIRGTPTLFVNDELIQGAPSVDKLSGLIEQHSKDLSPSR